MAEDKVKHIHIDGPEDETKAEAEAKAGLECESQAEQADAKCEGAEEAKAESGSQADAKADAKEEAKADTEAGNEADAKADAEDAKADAKEKAAEQESERYMRLMAEFQNFKRRAAKEKSDIHAYANEKIVGELLPVLDNFERALESEPTDIEGYVKGMELIFTQLKTALEHAGLSEIPALGEEFDPNVHNAVMTDQSEEHDDGKVSKVLQKGYKLNDKVIRPSMVAVVRK